MRQHEKITVCITGVQEGKERRGKRDGKQKESLCSETTTK